ncbi:MAG TPA: hypothetical protein VE287_04165 [Actinopolymorphaceae bacterium]|nr:hypothetical protein [Actinopolymorphaceae bacterium]
MPQRIRAAGPDDAPGVAALLLELGYPDNDIPSVRERLVAWTSEPHGTVLVAEEGERIAGLVAVAAIPYLERFDCAQMEVTSANRRADAHAFYRSLGYENWSDRAGRFLKDLVPGFSAGSFAARFPAER